MEQYVGIEIGGTKIQVVTGDATGTIAERRRFTVDIRQGGDGIRRQIESAILALMDSRTIDGVGVGFGGPIDRRTGRVTRSHQVSGWTGFELAAWLRQLTGVPVTLDNDANIAALGEALAGAGRGANPVFYVTLGSGVGGGLVVGGRIYHGACPGESEFGHILLDREGVVLEDTCSGWAVDTRIRALKAADSSSCLVAMTGAEDGGESRHLAAALKQNDPTAHRILTEVTRDLAFGLSHVVHLMHPQRVVLGGGLSLIGEPLRSAVAAALEDQIMAVFRPGPEIVIASLGEDVVPVGCLLAAGASR